jgi:glyoxylase-like metal-dependent hydrolase (beta-lactamase superfamily II)
MVTKIFDGLHGFIWQDNRQNNCNTFLIDAGKRILIDPGHSHLFGHVEQALLGLKIDPRSIDLILITHAHPDHMEAALLFKKPTMLTMSRTDFAYLKELAGDYYKIPEPDFFLQAGELEVGDLQFEVIETPGHTPGSICLYWPKQGALFTGDLAFDQGIGRTDLPGGSGKQLKESITKVEALQAQYLLPGHGGVVSGAKSVSDNFKQIRDYWFRYL